MTSEMSNYSYGRLYPKPTPQGKHSNIGSIKGTFVCFVPQVSRASKSGPATKYVHKHLLNAI